VRAHFEERLGRDFGDVRVHTDGGAADSARALDARAYSIGHDIVFGAGEYRPDMPEGRRLLAHELTHVAQVESGTEARSSTLRLGQPHDAPERQAEAVAAAVMLGQRVTVPRSAGLETQIQRQGARGGATPAEPPKINYSRAERENTLFAGPNSLGWATKLETAAGGAHAAWATLWKDGKTDEFADAVGAFQVSLGWPTKSVDGVLGPKTWWRAAGLGEAIAGIEKVGEQSEGVCTLAAQERIKRGYRLATGKSFTLPEGKTPSTFRIILQSFSGLMLDVDEQYRGTGAAGALVYSGIGEFVPEADIWAGKLRPGAAIQVWWYKKDYDLLRKGEIEVGRKKRRITDADADFYGTAFVFVRYDTATNERMLVRHLGGAEWKDKSSYEVWVAANPISPP
jgi:hypothetical protein